MRTISRCQPFRLLRFPAFILSLLIFTSLFTNSTVLAGDYKFLDPEGNEIIFPKNKPVFSEDYPGPWKGLESFHEPLATWKIKKEGLETIRRILIRVPHPAEDPESGYIRAIYVLDKDGLVVGYHAFHKDKEITAEVRVNGVINYVQIYVECTKHGLWRKDYALK